MKRALLAVACLAWSCTAPTIEVAKTSDGTFTLSVESWNVDLRLSDSNLPMLAANAADSIEREGVLTDVLCLAGVPRDEQRAEILRRSPYAHVGFVATNRDTPVDDPRDLFGVPQTRKTGPACTTEAEIEAARALITCLAPCFDAAGHLKTICNEPCPPPPPSRCGTCLERHVRMARQAEIVDACTNDPRGELLADGRVGAVILSQYPLRNVTAHVFPYSSWPLGAVSATVEKHGHQVDVICVDAMPWMDVRETTPYAGRLTGDDAGAVERWLAQQRALDLTIERARTRPTVLLGGPFHMYPNLARPAEPSTEYTWHATHFVPIFTPESGIYNLQVRQNYIAQLYYFTTAPPAFDGYAWVAGATVASIDERAVTRNELRYTYKSRKIAAAPLYGARATLHFAP